MKNTIKDFDLDLKTTKNNSDDYSSGNFNLYILKNR